MHVLWRKEQYGVDEIWKHIVSTCEQYTSVVTWPLTNHASLHYYLRLVSIFTHCLWLCSYYFRLAYISLQASTVWLIIFSYILASHQQNVSTSRWGKIELWNLMMMSDVVGTSRICHGHSKGQVSTTATNSEFGSTRDWDSRQKGETRGLQNHPTLPGVSTIDF